MQYLNDSFFSWWIIEVVDSSLAGFLRRLTISAHEASIKISEQQRTTRRRGMNIQ